ncbi:MAG: hypothetical protein UZ13_00154 [Chloroflexi bacterium OLB13]|nr:MAG: hypothetical protein UZ13_00154 [Chloroflexi bacterium OLB13]
MTVLQQMLQVQATFESQILSKPNVVGVAVGLKETEGVWTDTIALVALVERKLPLTALSAEARIPRQIDSIPTDVYEVGQLKALQLLPPTSRFRPTIPPGVSIGHFAITAGTLGAVVKDRITGEKLLLSNNHVFANSNDAQVGDSILQPGPADGGQTPATRSRRWNGTSRSATSKMPTTRCPTRATRRRRLTRSPAGVTRRCRRWWRSRIQSRASAGATAAWLRRRRRKPRPRPQP